jgi:hypothetical protein
MHLEVKKGKKKKTRWVDRITKRSHEQILSRNHDDLVIVAVQEQGNSNLGDQGPTEDNNGINTDDDKVSDHENENKFNPSATESASIDGQPIFTEDIYDPRN